jgi:hypothetical protein
MQRGDNVGGCLARAILRAGEDIPACEGNGYGFLLNWGRLLESGLEDAAEQLTSDEEVLEVETLGCGDILPASVLGSTPGTHTSVCGLESLGGTL